MDEISYSGDRPKRTRRLSKRSAIFLVFLILILGLVAGLIFFVMRKDSKTSPKEIKITEEKSSPTPTITIAPKESPTPTAVEKKENLKISVQNGSGESGVAAKAAGILKDAGYVISSTGNADNYDYQGVTIQIKSSKKSFLNGLKQALSSDYSVSSTSTDLSEDESFDALVIIGQ